jgi:hypothetical protein
MSLRWNPPLRVYALVATRSGDAERGPQISMNAGEAAKRMIVDGELVWVQGPRRQELAELRIDESLPRGEAVLRDVVGASPSEIIQVVKVDLDEKPERGHFA